MSPQRMETLLLAVLLALLAFLGPGHSHGLQVERLFHLSPDDVEELAVVEGKQSRIFLRPENGWLSGGPSEEAAFWVLWELSSLRRDLVPADQSYSSVRTLKWRQDGHWHEVGLGRLGADRLVTLETGGRTLWAPGELLDRIRDLVPDKP